MMAKKSPPEAIPIYSGLEDIQLTVPQVSVDAITIKKLSLSESVKNLVLYVAVNGDSL